MNTPQEITTTLRHRSATGHGALLLFSALLLLAACKKDQTACPDPPPAGCVVDESYTPLIDPANFTGTIDNPWYSLLVGTVRTYEGLTDEGAVQQVVITVTTNTRVITGVTCVEVLDEVFIDGEIVESTKDWFAQDVAGNVWYFGEEVQDYVGGVPSGNAGSWEAGVDGALPGIKVPANPYPGAIYRQEYYACDAEDMAEVLLLDEAVTVPFGTFTGCVQTREWTPLDPIPTELKSYAAGVGLLWSRHEDTSAFIELVDVQ